MEITTTMQENIVKLLGLDSLPKAEMEAVFTDLGTSIVETALLQFLTSQGEWEQQAFASWVDDCAGAPDILEQMVTMYPTFGKILTEEILQLKENFSNAMVSSAA